MAQTDFEIAEFLSWARTKPADERYDFFAPEVCALGQFACEQRGFSRSDARSGYYMPRVGKRLYEAVHGAGVRVSSKERWTFGALVKRLEKLCPETPVNASNWASIDAYLIDLEMVSA